MMMKNEGNKNAAKENTLTAKVDFRCCEATKSKLKGLAAERGYRSAGALVNALIETELQKTNISKHVDDHVSASIIDDIASLEMSDNLKESITSYIESRQFVDGINCIAFLLSVIGRLSADIVKIPAPKQQPETLAAKYHAIANETAPFEADRHAFFYALDDAMYADDLLIKRQTYKGHSLITFTDDSAIATSWDDGSVAVLGSQQELDDR